MNDRPESPGDPSRPLPLPDLRARTDGVRPPRLPRTADGPGRARDEGAAADLLPGGTEAVTSVLLVGLAAGILALTIAQGRISEPVRRRLGDGWLGELASCPLCLAAWLSAGLTLLQGAPSGVNPVVAWGASWATSAALAGLLGRLYERPG